MYERLVWLLSIRLGRFHKYCFKIFDEVILQASPTIEDLEIQRFSVK